MRDLAIALRSMYRNKSMTLISTSLIVMTMLVFSILTISVVNVVNITNNVSKGVKVYAYLEKGLTEEKLIEIEEEIKLLDGVYDVTFSSKDDELERLISNLAEDDQNAARELFSGDDNPLYDIYNVEVANASVDREDLKMEIENIDGVSFVLNPNAEEMFLSILNLIIKISIGLVIFLFAVTILLINNTISLTIRHRKKEIEIMKLVGAKNSKVMAPFIFEGIIMGLIGGLVAIGVSYYLYTKLLNMPVFMMMGDVFIEPTIILHYYLIIVPVISAFIGIISSFFTVNKHTKV